MQSHRRGFTLLELLIVIAIIGVLAGLLLTALSSAKTRADIAVARSQLSAISAALAMYEQDQGSFPRLAPRTGNGVFVDDAPALFAGLMNRPTLALGGGPNSPYLENWKPEGIGLLTVSPTTFVDPIGGHMGANASVAGWSGTDYLPETDFALVKTPGYQTTYAPGGGNARRLALLDPWGNPYHYREWASLRQSSKDAAITGGAAATPAAPFARTCTPAPPAAQVGAPPFSGTIGDFPHNPETFDMWSNGPNGINEFGHPQSDDVANWSDGR